MESARDVLQGTLDLLILKAASLQPNHGWGIGQRIRRISRGTLELQQGSLYPALHRLTKRGLLQAWWGVSENNRRARFYRITASGRRRLARETEAWHGVSAVVNSILATGA